MSDYVNQHWIPRGYLLAWCDPEPTSQNPLRVHCYNANGTYQDFRHPENIFSEPDLYTQSGSDGERNLETEHMLGELDGRFGWVRQNLLMKGKPLREEARRDILWFIAAQRNRSPGMRDQRARLSNHVLKIASSMEEGLARMSADERAEWNNATHKSPSKSDGKGIPLREFRKIAARPFGAYLPQLIVDEFRLLKKMRLTILRASKEQAFITSDRPVVMWDPMNPPPSRLPSGLNCQKIEIIMPLSPSLCALISHAHEAGYGELDVESVDAINMRTLYYTREIFISHRPDLVVDWQEGAPQA